MNSILLYEKSFSGQGRNLIKNFIGNLQDRIVEDVFQYSMKSKGDQGTDHLFWYGEQQLKTAVTSSIYNICDGYLMQEPGIARKVNKSKEDKNDYKNGRVDYWCRFGNATKISILLEIKHAWIRYYSPEKWTIYQYALDRHESAVGQIRDIEKSDLIVDNLYGIALTILPVFKRHNSLNEDVDKIGSVVLSNICRDAMTKDMVHACGGCEMHESLLEILDWSNEEKKLYESYPGIIFLWSIYKFTKK